MLLCSVGTLTAPIQMGSKGGSNLPIFYICCHQFEWENLFSYSRKKERKIGFLVSTFLYGWYFPFLVAIWTVLYYFHRFQFCPFNLSMFSFLLCLNISSPLYLFSVSDVNRSDFHSIFLHLLKRPAGVKESKKWNFCFLF